MTEELAVPAVKKALNTKWIGRHYSYFPQTNSTNDLLKEAVLAGDSLNPPTGTVFLTDFQEKGRGRLNRSWVAPPGTSLLLSILFRPAWSGRQLGWLTMLAGLAVADAVEEQTNLRVALKWPNDVLLSHEQKWRKACGILLEGYLGEGNHPGYAIVGIGINVNIPADELPETAVPATSLLAAVGQPVSRLALLTSLLSHLESYYEQANQGVSPQAAWNQRLVTLGRQVEVKFFGESKSLIGMAVDTDEWGHLLVRTEDGEYHTISAGDVSLREFFT